MWNGPIPESALLQSATREESLLRTASIWLGMKYYGVISSILVAALCACPAAPASAAASDSVVQFKVDSAGMRLSHDMKFVSAVAANGSQCRTITFSPTTDKFPGTAMANVTLPVSELTGVWFKAADHIKADDAGCLLLVTAEYTDATFTRPATP